MADTVTTKTLSNGFFGDGVNKPNVSDPMLYRLTPKYNDPQQGASSRIARFFMDPNLVTQINSAFGSSAGSSGVQLSGTDAVLQQLTNPNSGYFEFFLQSVDEVFSERYQIVETLGDNYAVFGLGKKPRIFNFSGALINSVENDWRVNFIYLFQKFISISQLAKFGGTSIRNIITLKYDSVFVQGAVLDFRTGLRAENEMVCPFSFPMLITKFDPTDLTKLAAANFQTVQDQNGTASVAQATGAGMLSNNADQSSGISQSAFVDNLIGLPRA
jgi:hypothetical protein